MCSLSNSPSSNNNSAVCTVEPSTIYLPSPPRVRSPHGDKCPAQPYKRPPWICFSLNSNQCNGEIYWTGCNNLYWEKPWKRQIPLLLFSEVSANKGGTVKTNKVKFWMNILLHINLILQTFTTRCYKVIRYNAFLYPLRKCEVIKFW